MLINQNAISQAEHTALFLSNLQPISLSSAAQPMAQMATSRIWCCPVGSPSILAAMTCAMPMDASCSASYSASHQSRADDHWNPRAKR